MSQIFFIRNPFFNQNWSNLKITCLCWIHLARSPGCRPPQWEAGPWSPRQTWSGSPSCTCWLCPPHGGSPPWACFPLSPLPWSCLSHRTCKTESLVKMRISKKKAREANPDFQIMCPGRQRMLERCDKTAGWRLLWLPTLLWSRRHFLQPNLRDQDAFFAQKTTSARQTGASIWAKKTEQMILSEKDRADDFERWQRTFCFKATRSLTRMPMPGGEIHLTC